MSSRNGDRRNLSVGIVGYLAVASARVEDFPIDSPRRRLYTRIGQWLERNTEPEASVAYNEIGMAGWASRPSPPGAMPGGCRIRVPG